MQSIFINKIQSKRGNYKEKIGDRVIVGEIIE